MKGIINIGNSCYMNAAIQLLFNSSDFIKIINKLNLEQLNLEQLNLEQLNSGQSIVNKINKNIM